MIKRSLLLSLLLAATAVQAEEKAPAQPDLAKAKMTAEQVCGACHTFDGSRGTPAERIATSGFRSRRAAITTSPVLP